MSSSSSTRPKLLALLGALLGVVGVGLGVQAAFSKPGLAPPTITTKPAAATASSSATFAFTGPSGATFRCSLDSAAFTACASPKSYSALAQGTHTFAVKSVKGAVESSATSYTWSVDTTPPPAPTLTAKPAAQSNTSTPAFAFSVPEPGVTFQCALDAAAFSACTSPKSYSGLSQTSHTFRVKAVDAAGNQGAVTSYGWTVDTTAPAAPTLTVKPTDPTYNATNFFEWTGPADAATYQCSLENGGWATCSSRYTWVIATSNYGQHQFAVRTLDAAGNASVPAQYRFKYEKKLPTTGLPFDISGSVDGLTIGLWRDVHVTVTNPNSVTMYVNTLTMSISATSSHAGCLRDDNLEWEQSDVSSSKLLAVPAGGQVTLPAQGIRTPRIRLRNLPDVNQDACKGVSFGLTFSGTATN